MQTSKSTAQEKKYLIAPLRKHQNYLWNLFKVNNKDIRMKSLTSRLFGNTKYLTWQIVYYVSSLPQ